LALAGAHWQSAVHLSTAGQIAAGLFAAFGFALMMAAYLGNRSFSVLFVEGITLLLLGFGYQNLRTMSGRSTQSARWPTSGRSPPQSKRDKPTPTIFPRQKPGRSSRAISSHVYQAHASRGRLPHEFRYEAWKDHYAIASAGHDWKFEKSSLRQYRAGGNDQFRLRHRVSRRRLRRFPEGAPEGTEYAWKDSKALFDEATTLYRANRYSDAIRCSSAISASIQRRACKRAHRMSLGQVGRLQESIPYLKKAIAGDTTDYQSPSNLGLVYEKLGKPEEGIEGAQSGGDQTE